MFNIVRGELTCPRCRREVTADVETWLGWMHELLTLQVGDRYPWNHPEMPSARSDGGNAVGDGYCVCPWCERDFINRVVVEGDIIRRLEPDTERNGVIPDIA